MELILMRHGTTQGNLERRFIGTLDVPLLPQGEELARRVGATLPAVEHIYRSPLQRCRRTLMALLAKYGRPERDYYGWMCPNCGGFRAELNPDTLELTILEEYRGEKGL